MYRLKHFLNLFIKVGFPSFFISFALIISFNYINFNIKENRAENEATNLIASEQQSAQTNPDKISYDRLVLDSDVSGLMRAINNNKFSLFVVSANKQFNNGNPTILYSELGSDKVHRVVLNQSTYNNIESTFLLPKQINFQLSNESYDSLNKTVLTATKPVQHISQKFDTMEESISAFKWSFASMFFWMILIPFLFKIETDSKNSKTESPAYTNNHGGKAIHPDSISGDIDELIGLEDIKQEVLQIQHMIQNRALYKSHDLDKPFNILMSGPAGTGKTKMASYLAKSLNIPMYSQPAGALETGLIGGGSQTLNDLYKEAYTHPMSLVFLDEGQVLLEKRGKDLMRKNADDTANALLSILDGTNVKGQSQVITVIASNFNDANYEMDDAMLRRFPIKIDFRLPNLEERKDILKYYLGKKDSVCVDYDNTNLNYIADITAGMSPALLNGVTDKASLIAIQEEISIDTSVLFRAFERCSVGLTDRAQTKGRDEERKRIAIHELGHFFTQIQPLIAAGKSWKEVKESSKLLKISTEAIAKVNALGYVLNSQEDRTLKTLTQLEQEVVELYGGAAAEEYFYGKENISIGSSNDFEKATKILDVMVNKLSMYAESKLNYSLLGEVDRSANIKQMEEISSRLYVESIQYIQANADKIKMLTDILLDKYVLTKDEVFDILESV